MKSTPTQRLCAEFMEAMWGIPFRGCKQAFAAALPSHAYLPEANKSQLAMRYAKGRLSRGGEVEHQIIRNLNLQDLATAARALSAPMLAAPASMTADEELSELRALVQGVVDNRGKCFIPNDIEGLSRWDERAARVLSNASAQAEPARWPFTPPSQSQ